MSKTSGCGAVYGLGMLGALVYFLQQSSGLGQGVGGIVKALLWPAFVVNKLMVFLGV